MALLEDVLADPAAKVVVFSPWLGTHELIVRRLPGRGWGHVLFNGSVPGDQRGALVQRFHDDPQCRLFLATDAGGVGLNLQHAAAVVVNMDMPWNPAVLEQRIGRVHRMGQRRGVQVVNFVGQGSIEEGMLAVLAFKKSLFAGVLDGGAADVFMQGTRLASFMKSVEEVAGAMGQADDDVPAGAADGMSDATVEVTLAAVQAAAEEAVMSETAPEPGAAPATAPDPMAALLQAGAALLQSLAQARAANGSAPFSIEPDPHTGRPSLRLPLPEPALLQQLARALQPWLH